MAFKIPTLDDTHAFGTALAANLLAKMNGGKGPNLARGSFIWLFLRTVAGVVTDNHAHIASVLNDLLPDTALGEDLDRWGRILKLPRKPATPSRKSKALRVSGTATTPVTVGLVLQHTSGTQFQVTTTDLVGPDGDVDVDIEALSTGSATRLSANEVLTFSNTPAGLDGTAELQKDLDEGGEDQELDGAYRLRILDRFQNPPLGGSANDYVQWALAMFDVGASFCYPRRNGLGTVDLVALHAGSGSDRTLTAPELADVQFAIDQLRPVSVAGFRVVTVTTRQVDAEYLYIPDGAVEHEPDWNDATPGVVLSYDVPTRKLQFTGGAGAPTLKAGDRIIVKPAAGGGTGEQRIVEAFDLVNPDKVILEAKQGAIDPVATDTIYAGGPLADPIRNAILALFDSLGTANPDTNRYGAWEGNLRPGAVSRVAGGVTGVLDGTVATPGATVVASDPAFPDNGTIELLIPRLVLARAAH